MTKLTNAAIEKPIEQFLVAFLGAVPATLLAIAIGMLLGCTVGFAVRIAHAGESSPARSGLGT